MKIYDSLSVRRLNRGDMENIALINSNSCCNANLKLKCWLILAKYGASKLEIVKQLTQDAALDEFETRLYLKTRFALVSDKFTHFMRNVFDRTMKCVSDYICSPDWSIFLENGKSNAIAVDVIRSIDYEFRSLLLWSYDDEKGKNCRFGVVIDQENGERDWLSTFKEVYLFGSVSYLQSYGNDSLWLLNTVIREEILIASSLFTSASHSSCVALFCDVKNEIFSVIDPWSDTITFSYSNFISATLSNIFVRKMKDLITRYELVPQSVDTRWLCEDIMKPNRASEATSTCSEDDTSLWFINCSLGLQCFDDSNDMDDLFFYTDNELCEKLTDWLFVECLSEFRATTERVLQLENDGKQYAARIYGKEKLSSLLDLPVSDLEFQLMLSEDQFRTDINVAEGPHYYVPVPDLTELQMYKREDSGDSFAAEPLTSGRGPNASFDLLETVFQDYGDTELNNKISDIKVELNEFCAGESMMTNGYEERMQMGCGEYSDELETMPKLQVISKHKARENEHEHTCPTTVRQQKRRGRPRKVDEYNQASAKNGQHKYSQENVLDCSNWINDNFFEVAGNKPAIDRARLYELYTNYCLLKLCTPVDRALFGKIIRKVFPKLRSRRLIQNQVLKYHYVGLKPKFAELEQALLYADSSMNPQEIVLSYIPVDTCA